MNEVLLLKLLQTVAISRGGVEDTRLEGKAKDQGHRRQVFSKKKRFSKFFLGDLQTLINNSKNAAVLQPKTGKFSRT